MKELKPYRSHAERIAVKQRYVQIAVSCAGLIVTLLTCLRVFGIL